MIAKAKREAADETLNMKVTPSLYRAVANQAQKEQRSMSSLIKYAVTEYLKKAGVNL